MNLRNRDNLRFNKSECLSSAVAWLFLSRPGYLCISLIIMFLVVVIVTSCASGDVFQVFGSFVSYPLINISTSLST